MFAGTVPPAGGTVAGYPADLRGGRTSRDEAKCRQAIYCRIIVVACDDLTATLARINQSDYGLQAGIVRACCRINSCLPGPQMRSQTAHPTPAGPPCPARSCR